MKTYFGYRNSELITIVQTTVDGYENAIDVDYTIADPQEADKQIAEWKAKNQ